MIKKIFDFYTGIFKNMGKLGYKLIIIILVKVFIMFAILKVFFFKDYLSERYKSDKQKSEHVINQLINP